MRTYSLRYFHRHVRFDNVAFSVRLGNPRRRPVRTLENFRFADGYTFDFRGIAERALNNKQRTLADSNQRGFKRFVPTYAFERNFGGWAGQFNLDWFFVKLSSRTLAMFRRAIDLHHFPITMRELNESVKRSGFRITRS